MQFLAKLAMLPLKKLFSNSLQVDVSQFLCRPYGTEVCGLNKSDIHSLDFPVNRFLMKLFRTANSGVINDCLLYFGFKLPSVLIVERNSKFVSAYNACNNVFCKLFNSDKSRFQM